MLGFIKNLNFLKEHNNSEDLFGYTEQALSLLNYLDSLPKNTSILALIGPYGIGKSFLLNLVRQQFSKKKQHHWFNFEAWRYTDRKDLWRAFIAEINEDVSKTIYKHKFALCPKKILNDLRILLSGAEHLVLFIIIVIIVIAASLLLIFKGASFLEAFTSVATLFALMFVVLKLYSKNPMLRQEMYETSLKAIIKMLNKKEYQKLYVVLEDIDRSGDQGFLFIETLSLFVRRYHAADYGNLSVRFIIPMSNHAFEESKQNASLMKAMDYCHPFNVQQLDIKGFVAQVFKKEFADAKMQDYVEKVFNIIFASSQNYPPNLRTWKTILRGANARYIHLKTEKGFKVNPLICIVVEMMKYYKIDGNQSYEKTLFESVVSRHIIEDEEITNLLIHAAQGLEIDAELSQHLRGISRVLITSKSPSGQSDAGFYIKKYSEESTPECRISRCYFDDLQNAA